MQPCTRARAPLVPYPLLLSQRMLAMGACVVSTASSSDAGRPRRRLACVLAMQALTNESTPSRFASTNEKSCGTRDASEVVAAAGCTGAARRHAAAAAAAAAALAPAHALLLGLLLLVDARQATHVRLDITGSAARCCIAMAGCMRRAIRAGQAHFDTNGSSNELSSLFYLCSQQHEIQATQQMAATEPQRACTSV